MTDSPAAQLDMVSTPGVLLRNEREAQGMTERDAADRLNWMPDYVAVIESDNYTKLRNPAFARGYVKAYGRLMGLDQEKLIALFDRIRAENTSTAEAKRKETKPLHLQSTGLGVAIGLSVLVLLIIYMWWRST